MITALLLLLLGLLLILIEFYLPGGIIGIAGGIAILFSIVTFATDTQSPLAIILYIIFVGIMVGLLIKYALWRIVHTKPEYSIYSNKDQEGYVASGYDHSAVGKTGIVLSDLKPGGHILIEGKSHQAISMEGYIQKGEAVLVISGEGESLKVKRKS